MATKTLWDHVNHIVGQQTDDYYDTLTEADRRTFAVYMINRALSMTPDYLPTINQLQTYYGIIPDRLIYRLYKTIFPKRKTFSKYIKANKQQTYEPWVLELVARHFRVSTAEAHTYVRIYYKTDAGFDELISLCQGYGIDHKLIKKLKR